MATGSGEGRDSERDPGGCENQRGRGGAPPHTPLPGRLMKKAQSLRGRLFIGLRARPVATASACTCLASGGAPGLLADARVPERLRRPLAPGCAETGEYPSPPRPGLGHGGCGKRSAVAEHQAPQTARPHCILTSNPPPPPRVISPSLGCLLPFLGVGGPHTYLNTPVRGRATPEAGPVPQGTSSSSSRSSSSRSRGLLDTWQVSITCGHRGQDLDVVIQP